MVAMRRGSERPDEYVVYSAHWDHISTREEGEDRVFNGAIDNATGTVSRSPSTGRFRSRPPTSERDRRFAGGWRRAMPVAARRRGFAGAALSHRGIP